MHNVRKVKAREGKIWIFFTLQMASTNRKQVPLCQTHHKALHRNNLSSLERQQFKAGIERLK